MGDLVSSNGFQRTISVDEAARLLGVSRAAYYNRVRAGDVPFIRIGRRIRVPADEIERWLHSQGPYVR
jgi:excisionase family DNA binding protein